MRAHLASWEQVQAAGTQSFARQGDSVDFEHQVGVDGAHDHQRRGTPSSRGHHELLLPPGGGSAAAEPFSAA